MARGNFKNKKKGSKNFDKKSSQFRGNRNSVHKPKNRKKTKRKFEKDDTHNQEIVKRQKTEEKLVSSDESDEEIENPLKQLLGTFNINNTNKMLQAVESESEESSADEENGSQTSELEEEIGESVEEGNYMKDEESEEDNSEIESQVSESDIEQNSEEIQEDLTLNDPFVNHLCYDLHDDFVDFLQNKNEKVQHDLEWPNLGKIKVTLPKYEQASGEKYKFTITEAKKNAPLGTIPQRIKNVDLEELAIKTQIQKNIKSANKCISEDSSEIFTPLQAELFSIVNNYQDLLYTERTFDNAEQIRYIYCLHAINHILKTRIKILHHNTALKNKMEEIVPDEYRDQGLVRPKVLIIVPFRDCALRIVQNLMSLLVSEDKGQVFNKLRFLDDFSGGELILPKKNPKPEDYEKTFTGNCDDTFKIGIQVTKKSLKLYADFYNSDIIIASPLGLRLTVGAEGEAERDYDFLASVELLVLDQAELFLMQNWDHLMHVLSHMHLQPRSSHGTDFSRIRNWSISGWSKYYRQTLIFSSFPLPEINSILNKKCFNYCGCVKTNNTIQTGAILKVHTQVPQVFRKFYTDSFSQCIGDRFDFFINKVLPQFRDTIMKNCLIYVPSYFDYVKIRNYFKKEDISFVQICEYSKDAKVARARDIFFHGDSHFLLYSERFHYFRRIRLKGIRHIIFYQPPTFPHFYSELCNFMQESNVKGRVGSASNMSVTTLYSRYDALQLASIVGSDRISKMATSMKNFHMFTNTNT